MIPQVRLRPLVFVLGTVVLLWPSSGFAQTQSPDQQAIDRQQRDDVCAAPPEAKQSTDDECSNDEERGTAEQQRRMKEAEQKEHPPHTSFLKWIHIDGMWIPTTLGATTYGLIGT